MTGGELVSLLINAAVGVYFAWFFPRSLRGKVEMMPPVFGWLNRILPPVGYLLIAGSVIYGAARLLGLF